MTDTPTPSAMAPRPYNLDDPAERLRLARELRGYVHTCRKEHHGTDFEGRAFAIAALEQMLARSEGLELAHYGTALRENERMREALERLGSMEAFDISRAVEPGTDDELTARIEFARTALTDTLSPATAAGGEEVANAIKNMKEACLCQHEEDLCVPCRTANLIRHLSAERERMAKERDDFDRERKEKAAAHEKAVREAIDLEDKLLTAEQALAGARDQEIADLTMQAVAVSEDHNRTRTAFLAAEARLAQANELLRKVPKPPSGISWEHGVELLNELQALAHSVPTPRALSAGGEVGDVTAKAVLSWALHWGEHTDNDDQRDNFILCADVIKAQAGALAEARLRVEDALCVIDTVADAPGDARVLVLNGELIGLSTFARRSAEAIRALSKEQAEIHTTEGEKG